MSDDTTEHYDPTAGLMAVTREACVIIRRELEYLNQAVADATARIPDHQHAEGDAGCLYEARLSLVDSFARMVGAMTRTLEETLADRYAGDHDAPERVTA